MQAEERQRAKTENVEVQIHTHTPDTHEYHIIDVTFKCLPKQNQANEAE